MKHQVKDGILGALTVILALWANGSSFGVVSGGIFNPAIALMCIVWHNITWQYDENSSWSNWTPDMAGIELIAPMFAGYIAGNIFNYQKRLYKKIEDYQKKKELEIEEDKKVIEKLNVSNKLQSGQSLSETSRPMNKVYMNNTD